MWCTCSVRATRRTWDCTTGGTIAPGKKADLNLVNLDRLTLKLPQIVPGLPTGGRHMVQRAEGYVATFDSGQAVTENGEITAARPGRWVPTTRDASS